MVIQQPRDPLVGDLRIDRLRAKLRLILQTFKTTVDTAMPQQTADSREKRMLGDYGSLLPPHNKKKYHMPIGILHEQ